MSDSNRNDACAFARLIVQFIRDAHQHSLDRQPSSAIVLALEALVGTLRGANRTYDVASTYRTLNTMDPHTFGDEFVISLYALGDTQYSAGRTDDALGTRIDCLSVCCDMYTSYKTYEWRKQVVRSIEARRLLQILQSHRNGTAPLKRIYHGLSRPLARQFHCVP